MPEKKTSKNKHDHEVGRGKPPMHRRFRKGQSGGQPAWTAPEKPATIAGRGAQREGRRDHRRQALGVRGVLTGSGADIRWAAARG
jgi:hypothetical protein